MTRLNCILIVFLLFLPKEIFSQTRTVALIDSSETKTEKHHSKMTNRLTRDRFWGNATILSSGYTQVAQGECLLEAGRGIATDFDLGWSESDWGLGYSHLLNTPKNCDYARLYYEASATVLVLGVTGRLELMASTQMNAYYLRPYAGITISPLNPALLFDIQYSYAFLFGSGSNLFKNGITLRARVLLNQKKWQHIDIHFS